MYLNTAKKRDQGKTDCNRLACFKRGLEKRSP